MTVVFCDLAESTAFADAHDPEVVTGVLSGYFDVVRGDNEYYKATVAWDNASGWGTPNLLNFYNAALRVYFKK